MNQEPDEQKDPKPNEEEKEQTAKRESPDKLTDIRDLVEVVAKRQEEVARVLSGLSPLRSNIEELCAANYSIADFLAQQINPLKSLMDEFAAIQSSWRAVASPIQQNMATFQSFAHNVATAWTGINIASELLFAKIDFQGISAAYNLSQLDVGHLIGITSDVVDSYNQFTELATQNAGLLNLSPMLIEDASRDFYTTALSFECLQPGLSDGLDEIDPVVQDKVELELSDCQAILQEIDPSLVRLHVGAMESIESTNVDKVRHFQVSLRELLDKFLKRLAPNSQIKEWIPQELEGEYLFNGAPTKVARMMFICRHVDTPQFNTFLSSDAKAFSELMKILNNLHEIEYFLSSAQLRHLLQKGESWIITLANRYFEGKRLN